jgi:hypothetical protein
MDWQEQLFGDFPSHVFLLDALGDIRRDHLRLPLVFGLAYLLLVAIASLALAAGPKENARRRRGCWTRQRPQWQRRHEISRSFD